MAAKKKTVSSEEVDEVEVEDTERAPSTVDRSRYLDLQRRHRKQSERVSELEGLIAELEPKAATVDQLTGKLKDQEKSFASERSTWEMDGVLRDAGISDAHGRTTAKALYGELPEQGRPKLGDWLADLKKDASKAPKPLQSYLQSEAQQQSQGAQGGQGQGQRPNPTAGVVGTATGAGSGAPTQAEIAAARSAALSGDRAPWDALQGRMGFATLPKFGGG